MPTTEPVSGWPVPEESDPPDGPAQMLALAAAIAKDLKGIQHGTIQITVGANAGDEGTATVTFPKPYASLPHVVVSYGPTSLNVMDAWSSEVTTTGFKAKVRREVGGGPGDVTWVAFGVLA